MMADGVKEIRCHHFSQSYTIAFVHSGAKRSEERLPGSVG